MIRKSAKIATFVLISLFSHEDAIATTCSYPAPCAVVRDGSILFVGTVVDVGVVTDSGNESKRDIRLQVDEIFSGLPTTIKEVTITAEGSWLEKGRSYLIDAIRGKDNRLYPAICGTTSEVSYKPISNVLEFLRQRKQGKATTSLAVRVTDQYKPVSDVDVTITSSEGSISRRTVSDGVASFNPLKAAKYSIAASRLHYRPDADSYSDEKVSVLTGTCASAQIALKAEAGVSGFVRDASGEPVAKLQVELVAAPNAPSQKVSLNEHFFVTKTDESGRFHFDSVSPGRYILGSNIIGLNTSAVPPVY